MSRSGADLALLLLGGFRSLVDAAVAELALRGYEDVRPVHDFAMRAIASGADNASELGRRLSVSKQAAAKTIAVLQERGYVAREEDPLDARRKRLQVTELGFDVLRTGEAIFDELRDQWERQIGPAQLESLDPIDTSGAEMRAASPGSNIVNPNSVISPRATIRPWRFASTAQPPANAARLATVAKERASPSSIGKPPRLNGSSARARTNGRIGTMHGVAMVSTPAR